MQNEKCKSCFECTETVIVKVRYDRSSEWRDSSVRRCANDQCWHIVDGTREDRLTWINNVYDYKYFGDYELSPEQLAAVYEAKSLAALPAAGSGPLLGMDHEKLLARVASIICEETCGLTSQCKSREAAKALYDQGYLSALSAQVQDVAGEHVAWRLRHKNDGPHMWEYYQLPEAEASDNVVIQKLTIKQLIDILNDDKHAGAQERPPEPHSPNASVPIDLLQKIWAEMYYGVGGEGGIDDSIAQWNLIEVVDILAMAGALPDVDEPTALAKQEGGE